MFEQTVIQAKTISDAWFQLVYNVLDDDKIYVQDIQAGSFEGVDYRRQYPGVAISIEFPDQDMIPTIPVALGIPAPTDMEYVGNYFAKYLMSDILEENETYTYGSRILTELGKGPVDGPKDTQLQRVIDMLKTTPLTNQAVIEIASPYDLRDCYGNDGKLDPPCLRLIDFKVIPVQVPDTVSMKPIVDLILTMTVYFRSWDLWAGLPTNLAGLELFKQYVASECGLKNGPMYAHSAGLHIYGYQEELAKIRTMKAEKEEAV